MEHRSIIESFINNHINFAQLILSNIEGIVNKDIDAEALEGNKNIVSIILALDNMEKEKGYIERGDVIEMINKNKREKTSNSMIYSFPKRIIKPRTEGQKNYMQCLNDNDIVIAIGPAGTGKTFLAVAKALNALLNRTVKKIILTRPAVEAGENLGFLPGDLKEKVDPYLRPLYDALYSMLERDRVERFINEEIIEIAPLAYMRGRTLSNSYLILDEAQNTTTKQMKMFITRMGMNSSAVITGDVTQIDLERNQTSGLIELNELIASIEGVASVKLSTNDIVRHPLVKEIIHAYNQSNIAKNS